MMSALTLPSPGGRGETPIFPDVVPPAERERWHEMLKISHLVIVLLFMRMRAPRTVTQLELSESLLIDRKTAAEYLRQLSARHFIAKVGYRDGYALAEGGNSMLEKWGKIGHFSLKESFKDIKDLKIKEKKEGKNEVGKNWTLPPIDLILSETGKLFEKEVVAFGVQTCDPLLALAMIAHAYDQRDRLRSPAVFVYQRLIRSLDANCPPDRFLPDKKYRLDPMQFLPNPFLHALGLAELEVVEDVEVSDVGSDEPVPDDVVCAWADARQQLDRKLEKGPMRQRLLNIVRNEPASFENGVVYLSVVSSFTKYLDYMNENAVSVVEALMPGVQVRFVAEGSVAVETGGA